MTDSIITGAGCTAYISPAEHRIILNQVLSAVKAVQGGKYTQWAVAMDLLRERYQRRVQLRKLQRELRELQRGLQHLH